MKKEHKDKLKSMKIKDLQKTLRDMETERMKMEATLRGFGVNRKSYTQKDLKGEDENRAWKGGNLKRINKNIARIKTYLNIKLKAGQ